MTWLGEGGRTRCVPDVLRWPLVVLAASGFVIAVAIGALFSSGRPPSGLDAWTVRRDAATGATRNVSLVLDYLGEPFGAAVLLVCAGSACLLGRRPLTALALVVGTGATILVTTAAKPLVGRTIHQGYLSFPSGHAGFVSALALSLSVLVAERRGLGRGRATALVVGVTVAAAAAMGWAEVVLNAHYPTDILGGFATALAVASVSLLVVDGVAQSVIGA